MPTIFCSFNKTAGKNQLTPEITAPSSLPSWYTPSQNAQTLKIGYKNSKNLKHFCQNLSDTWFFVPDGDSCCPWNVMRSVRAQHVRSRWLSSHSSLSLSLSLNWRRARSFSRCFSLSIYSLCPVSYEVTSLLVRKYDIIHQVDTAVQVWLLGCLLKYIQ